jgi:hypothetical protein
MTATTLLDLIDDKDAKFAAFHEAHPTVLAEIARLARQAKDRGWRRWSVKGAFEVLRYNLPPGHPLIGVRFNNDLTSRYARAVMAEYPDLEGFFETRALR